MKIAWQKEHRFRGSRNKVMITAWLFSIGFASQFHAVDCAHQLLCSVWDCNVVMFALTHLFRKVSGKALIPFAHKLCCVKQSVAKVSGAAFLHVGIAGLQLPWLIGRRRHACVSQYSVCIVKTGKITDLGKDHCPHTVTDPRDGQDGGMASVHDLPDGQLDFVCLVRKDFDQAVQTSSKILRDGKFILPHTEMAYYYALRKLRKYWRDTSSRCTNHFWWKSRCWIMCLVKIYIRSFRRRWWNA